MAGLSGHQSGNPTSRDLSSVEVGPTTMAWKHWEEYKAKVATRGSFGVYYQLGKAYIAVVEECGMEEEADAVIAKEQEIEPYHWDENFEDVFGERSAIANAVANVFWAM